jgi:sugar-specific transcriptional regulator TrmB
MDIKETLHDLGLEPKEASIYLALLELGEATVLNVSKKARVKRPTAYVVLQALETKGFVAKVLREKKIFYTAEHPEKLVVESQLRTKELKKALPQLESLMKKEGEPRVMIYEGKEELDRAYDDAFVQKGELLFMSTIKIAKESFPKSFRKLEYKTFSSDFHYRELVDESEYGKKYAEESRGKYRQIRFIPKELLPFDTDIGIFGNNVVITSAKGKYFTVRIESEEIAHAFRVIFEMMWQGAKE